MPTMSNDISESAAEFLVESIQNFPEDPILQGIFFLIIWCIIAGLGMLFEESLYLARTAAVNSAEPSRREIYEKTEKTNILWLLGPLWAFSGTTGIILWYQRLWDSEAVIAATVFIGIISLLILLWTKVGVQYKISIRKEVDGTIDFLHSTYLEKWARPFFLAIYFLPSLLGFGTLFFLLLEAGGFHTAEDFFALLAIALIGWVFTELGVMGAMDFLSNSTRIYLDSSDANQLIGHFKFLRIPLFSKKWAKETMKKMELRTYLYDPGLNVESTGKWVKHPLTVRSEIFITTSAGKEIPIGFLERPQSSIFAQKNKFDPPPPNDNGFKKIGRAMVNSLLESYSGEYAQEDWIHPKVLEIASHMSKFYKVPFELHFMEAKFFPWPRFSIKTNPPEESTERREDVINLIKELEEEKELLPEEKIALAELKEELKTLNKKIK